jgi:hypothetical protein
MYADMRNEVLWDEAREPILSQGPLVKKPAQIVLRIRLPPSYRVSASGL